MRFRYIDLKVAAAFAAHAGTMGIELEVVSAEPLAVNALVHELPTWYRVCPSWLADHSTD